ncbi:dihydrolipoyllysine-residue succinyltransferase [Malassezia psittaci]|uniref:dihydrolipoyllysine-residue succinyltransferase n=1 Tax=Malassezia psittaci TaxID=1821823 RepID=A0AAF0FEK4_9BASI|nr:dihydrolipoyllysine-residue succinyltransferase [Malassezia psittaci]
MLPLVSSFSVRVAARSTPLYSGALALAARRHLSTSQRCLGIVKVPQMAESISEGTLKQFTKKVGDYVKRDEELATIETDKIDVAVNSTEEGKITELLAEPEDNVSVGQDLVKIEEGEAPAEQPKDDKKEEPKKEEPKKDESKQGEPKKDEPKKDEPKKEEPKQPQQQQQQQQPLQSQQSSAPKKQESKPSSPSTQSTSAPPKAGERGEHRVKMNRMRKRIAERLKESQNTAASLTTFNEIDMSSLIEFRKRNKERVLKETGIKLGFMGAFAKASALALKEIPAANASIEGEGLGDTIVYRDYVDMSVAVSTERGLVTPVVRNADAMSILEIEKAIHDLGIKARDNKLSIEDMTGGTFTISNGGVFGSLFGTPILNLPGSAILGMHATKEKPWVVDGKVEVRPIMVVALTYDHRLLDGREAVTFLVKLKQYLEDLPTMLL